jgi:hypothetical protein
VHVTQISLAHACSESYESIQTDKGEDACTNADCIDGSRKLLNQEGAKQQQGCGFCVLVSLKACSSTHLFKDNNELLGALYHRGFSIGLPAVPLFVRCL